MDNTIEIRLYVGFMGEDRPRRRYVAFIEPGDDIYEIVEGQLPQIYEDIELLRTEGKDDPS